MWWPANLATGTGRRLLLRAEILTGVRNDMQVAQEEIFGPVLSVIPSRQ
ncbi:aldehyde dehydrogenase family protein [Pseudonocardia sp. MCCB 268]|nr:aldehyde dehydrogenase family protein [Pseudonocardia cytotoxica]